MCVKFLISFPAITTVTLLKNSMLNKTQQQYKTYNTEIVYIVRYCSLLHIIFFDRLCCSCFLSYSLLLYLFFFYRIIIIVVSLLVSRVFPYVDIGFFFIRPVPQSVYINTFCYISIYILFCTLHKK